MIRIGLAGYYGHGNFGDELFYECFKRYFPPPAYRLEVVSKSDPRMRRASDARLERFADKYDAVIIGGGDLVIPGYDVKNQYFYDEFLDVPVFVQGVGVPRWTGCDDGAFANLKAFFASPNIRRIVARDPESAEWINRHLKPMATATSAPDMAFSLADMLDRKTPPPERIETVGIVIRGGQNREGCRVPALIENLIGQGKQVKLIVLGNGRELDFDFADIMRLGIDEWPGVETIMRPTALDLLYAVSEVDALYSEKFHGCIAGLMHHIPTIAMIDTDKFANLYRGLGIERYLIRHSSEELPHTPDSLHTFSVQEIDQAAVDARTSMDNLKTMIDGLRGKPPSITGYAPTPAIAGMATQNQGKTMKRIGIVGYYGHGNFGDELFLHAFRRVFPINEYRMDLLGKSGGLMRKYRDSRLERIADTYDAIIIGGGDLLIPGYDVANQYFLEEFLQAPVFVHGVGVPTWTGYDETACANMKKFLRSDAIKGICVRDKEGMEWVNKNIKPKVQATCADDIVFSLLDTVDFRYRPQPEVGRIGIVLRGGQNKPDCKMKEFIHFLLEQGHALRFIMLGTGKELDYDMTAVEKLECLDSEQVDVVVRQSDVDLLHAFDGVDAVYSMKFHGCIAALMHGIPTFALITTDKFVNLYRKLGIENYIIHHTNARLFESVDLVRDFPGLELVEVFESATRGLYDLKASVNAISFGSELK